MPKVLLINTPLTREKFQTGEKFLPPLGLGYIATYLKKRNVEVELIDSLEENLGVEEVIACIRENNPEYVGLNVFTPNLEIVKDIIVHIPNHINIILGAQVMKSVYQEFVKWNKEHKLYMILGEGELIIPDIVLRCVKEKPILETSLCTVFHVTKSSVYFPRDLSEIKLNREIFKDRNLINKFGLEEACMISSRGCIYQCAFCGAANAKNPDTFCRVRKNEDIVEEINEIKRFTPHVSCIRMLDDLFLRNRNSILNAIQIFSNSKLNWRAMAHVLSFKESMDLLPQMKQSGCLELFIGIESGSEKMRNKIHKIGDIEYIFDLVTAMLKNGISVKGYFMYGFPEETEADMRKTYELAERLHKVSQRLEGNFRNSSFQFRPYHGTELYNQLKDKGKNLSTFEQDKNLASWKGRQQFNIISGNFSCCSQEKIDCFITKTLGLNGDCKC